MSLVARQSTARTIMVGPVLDSAGAAVTTAVVGDFKISKNGGAPAALNGSATLNHRHTGHYSLALTATDTDTVGGAQITLDKTTDTCPQKDITVIEEAVYDRDYAAAATGQVTLANGAHGGTAATLRLGGSSSTPAFYVTNSSGDAVQFESTGGTSHGMHLVGSAGGNGLRADGGATGHGFYTLGGATSGSGIRAEAVAGNFPGIAGAGFGSGAGLRFDAGATGAGVAVFGGATSGNGIGITTTDGHGINVNFAGASKVAINAGIALTAAGVQAIWDALTAALSTANSIGKLLVDNINATIGSRSSHAAADVTGGTTVAAAVTALTAEHDATQVTLALVKLSTDYPDDAVMLDPVNGTAGTTVGTHGTHRTPCTTFADASTIAAARGKNHIKFISGASVLVPSGTYQGYQVDLNGGNLFLNQDATFSGGSQIYSSQYGATLDPDWGGGQNTVDLDSGCFYENLIFSSSLRAIDNCYLRKCVLGYTSSAITFTILGDNGSNPVYLEDCYTAQISGLTFDCSGGADLLLQNWGGDFTITNLAAGTTVVIYGYAKVTVAASCTGGTVRHTSHVEVTDSSGGAVTMDLISEAGTVSGFTTAAKAELQQEAEDALNAYGASTVTTAQVNDEVLDVLNVDTLINGKTFVQAMKITAAGVAGKVSGAGTGTEVFVGLDGSTTIFTVTVDASGNRSAVVYA
jgi:hypothetical protein